MPCTATQPVRAACPLPTRAASSPARTWAPRLAGLILLWVRRHETRRALAKLDAERLADIGVGEAAARRECRKPFWRA